ncbi:MAG: exodeoxyribonuclease VII large subunit [Acidimicrobiia bacterium]|nr:exodeoxyribonuclease VII large subunit [Acidimicrobiia bacterium]
MEATYTVTEINRVITRAIGRALPDSVWVSGEIRNLSRAASGHVYFSLVDAGAVGAAQLPVVLFSTDRQAVNRALVRVSAGRIEDGMQVRIRGVVSYQSGRGLVQLRMQWIDTEYTLGRLAADRRALLERLSADGLLDAQIQLELPVAPHRIGVVTSLRSAAHADFVDELRRSGFGFMVLESHAAVQGAGAADSIVAALAALRSHRPDLVAVIRGGGAQTDLAVFDSEPVARAVATAPFPVITGIGHEIDDTVTDRVAAHSTKTPTACAQLVVGMVRDFAERFAAADAGVRRAAERTGLRARARLDARAHRLRAVATARFAAHQMSLHRAATRLGRAPLVTLRHQASRVATARKAVAVVASGRIDTAAGNVATASSRLRLIAPRVVSEQRRRVATLETLTKVHDPDRILARGWSVTRTASGTLVRSPAEVAAGDRLVTTTAGGDVDSVVEGRQA